MTPVTKIPTIAVFDTQPPARVFPNRLNTLPAPLYASEASDVAQMRAPEPLGQRAGATPVRGYSGALGSVSESVARNQQPYK